MRKVGDERATYRRRQLLDARTRIPQHEIDRMRQEVVGAYPAVDQSETHVSNRGGKLRRVVHALCDTATVANSELKRGRISSKRRAKPISVSWRPPVDQHGRPKLAGGSKKRRIAGELLDNLMRLGAVLDAQHLLDLPAHRFAVLEQDRAVRSDSTSTNATQLLQEGPKARSRGLEEMVRKDVGDSEGVTLVRSRCIESKHRSGAPTKLRSALGEPPERRPRHRLTEPRDQLLEGGLVETERSPTDVNMENAAFAALNPHLIRPIKRVHRIVLHGILILTCNIIAVKHTMQATVLVS